MCHQYLEWVFPDLGLGVKVSDPSAHQDTSTPIKVEPDYQVCYEVVFVFLGGVI